MTQRRVYTLGEIAAIRRYIDKNERDSYSHLTAMHQEEVLEARVRTALTHNVEPPKALRPVARRPIMTLDEIK